MNKSNKYAWSWKIKAEYLVEYIELHQDPWNEVLLEHTKAGIYNYSIFHQDQQFFYCFECDDVKEAFAYLAESEICQKWNAITSKMVEGSFDLKNSTGINPMTEVFYLP